MESVPEITPATLKSKIQEFISQHEAAGKSKTRKDVMAALKIIAKADYQTLPEAYDRIFATIKTFTDTPYKKSGKPHTPKIINFLLALRKEITMEKEFDEKQKAADQQRKAEVDRITKEKDGVIEAEQEKLRQATVKAKKRGSRHRKATAVEAVKPREDATATAKALDQAQEERALRIQAEEQREEERKQFKKQTAKLLEEKAQVEQRRIDELAAADRKRQEEARQADEKIAEARRIADENYAATRKKQAELAKAEEAKLEAVKQATARGVQEASKAYDKGFAEGKDEGSKEMVLYVKKATDGDPELQRRLREKFLRLEGSRVNLLLDVVPYEASQARAEEPAAAPRSQQQSRQSSNTSQPHHNQVGTTLITNKSELIKVLVAMRAELIGRNSNSSEERKNVAVTLAMIEYFICNMKLREHDKPMTLIMQDAYAFISAVGAGDCSVIKRQHQFDESETLTHLALTKESATQTVALLEKNPFGFEGTEAAKVFASYAKEMDLTKAEKRLRQTFVRAVEDHMIEEWLGTKYAVVKCLVDMYKKLAETKSPENLEVMQTIKLAVFLLVAHKDDKTAAKIVEVLKKLRTLSTEFLQTIQPHIDANEQISDQSLSMAAFGIFAALFQKAKFFVFSDQNVYAYFSSEGKEMTEKACIQTLTDVKPKQQQAAAPVATAGAPAPRGNLGLHPEVKQSSAARSTAEPLQANSSNVVGMDRK